MSEDPKKTNHQHSDITRMARDGHLSTKPPPDSDATRVTQAGGAAESDATRISAPPPSPPPEEPPGTPQALPDGYCLFEYRMDKVLGQGGFGITYLASDINLNSKVAIKEYLPQQFAQRGVDITVAPRSANDEDVFEKGLEDYLVEARTLATFRHRNIVRVARFFEANNTAYMVLEYERGQSLKTWWRRQADMPEIEILTLLAPLLDGLAVVHASGFLHRDIKPDNIYVRDEDGSLVLLDFGAAQHSSVQRSAETNFVTPGYGPIEQYALGEQGPWTDIYAFGATLYWMISGRKPIAAPDRMVDPDPLVPALEVGKGRYSTEFLSAIDWALMPETHERPRDVATFRASLFAAHPESLNLQDALRAGDREARLSRIGHALLKPASWPMAVKMTLAMVLAALLPMLITAYYNYTVSVERVSAGELRNIEQLAGNVSGRVAQLLGDSSRLAVFLSNDPDFAAFLQDPTPARGKLILDTLQSVARANPDVQVATVLNADGKALASSLPGVAGRNFGFRQYFLEAMRGRSYVTSIILGATAGEPGVFFANPINDPTGKFWGVVTLRIKGKAISEILESSRGDPEHIAMLIDADGIIIHHTDPKQLYKSLVPLPADKVGEIVYDQRFGSEKVDSVNMPDLAPKVVRASASGNVNFRSTISGRDEIAGFAPVKGHDWVVVMSESREVFEKPLNQMLRNVLLSVVLIGIVFLIIAVWFARSIVRPIERLTAAAHALKSADYEKANVRVTSMDEIGRFARVFNVMIDVLRQRERELGARRKKD
jgi:serine/threonine protein kinase/HAMP domain-containing protein